MTYTQHINKMIVERFPWLKVDEDYEFTRMDAFPDGWKEAFAWEMCERIDKEIDEFRDEFHVLQIKEKYGSLRFYCMPTTNRIEEIIDEYEKLSYETCVTCGLKATKRSTGWICPYCDRCASKLPNEKFENI